MVKVGDFVFLKHTLEKYMDPNKSHPLGNGFLAGNWIDFNEASAFLPSPSPHTEATICVRNSFAVMFST